ncbi:MAG: response regulator [Elusimicrobiota bacterium]
MANILVVDDDEHVRLVIKRLLTMGGHTVETASDGDDGLNKIARGKYDLLIIDELMPKITGTEAVGIIRASKHYPDLIILMLTGASVTSSVNAAYEAGIDGYVIKPFFPDRLMARIDTLLAKTA